MKSKNQKTTTADPYYYGEHEYIYGDPSEPQFSSDDWLFENIQDIVFDSYGITEALLKIYEIACFVGFFINLVHLFILTRKELRSNLVYIVMIGICICDIMQSFGKIFQLFMEWNIIYKIEPCADGYKYSHLVVDLVSKSLQIMCRRCSGFLILYVASFRTFSVMFPMSHLTDKLMNPKSGYLVVLLSGAVWAGWSSVYYLQTKFEKVSLCGIDYSSSSWMPQKRPSYVPYRLITNEKWEFKYLLIDGCIALVVCFLYVIVAGVLVFALCKNKKKRKNTTNDESSNPTTMIMFMAATVIISETTYGSFYLANHIIFQDYGEQYVFERLSSLVLTLLIFNSVIHVIICFFMSSQYRDTAKGLICGKKAERKMKTIMENTANSANNENEVSRTSNSSKNSKKKSSRR